MQINDACDGEIFDASSPDVVAHPPVSAITLHADFAEGSRELLWCSSRLPDPSAHLPLLPAQRFPSAVATSKQ